MKTPTHLTDEHNRIIQKNSAKPYGKGIADYLERWATLMEAGIDSNGADPETFIRDNADRLSHEADTDGITGAMYGCAVSHLARFWIHGEQLRRCQLGTEGDEANKNGGVLNPAVIDIQ